MTHQQRQAASQLVRIVAEVLLRPDMPKIGRGEFHDPSRLASFLATDAQLLSPPGRIQEKQYVRGDLQLAADYLSHPDVSRLRLAVSPASYARALREIVRDLKPKHRP